MASSLIEFIKDDCVTGDDGYKVYWPLTKGANRGALSAHDLREIADYLDAENAE